MKTINDYAELVKEKHALNETIAPVEADETDASKAYAVGEQLILSGILYDVIAPISQHDVITTTGSGANIAPAGPISSKIRTLTNEIDSIVNDLGVKNLLKINDISQTTNGVTISVNNGVITLNGTSTGQITLTLLNDYNSPIKSGSYIFNGLDDGSSNTISMVLNYYNSQGAEQPSAVAVNGDTPATIPADYNGHLKIYLIIANGQTFNNKVVKPMIRDASIKNADYAPYAMTNRELTDAFPNKIIVNDYYTYTAENTWEYTGLSFTLEKDSLVDIRAGYNNGVPNGVAVGLSSTNTAQFVALSYNADLSASKAVVAFLPAGTYYVWGNYKSANSNQIKATKLIEF